MKYIKLFENSEIKDIKDKLEDIFFPFEDLKCVVEILERFASIEVNIIWSNLSLSMINTYSNIKNEDLIESFNKVSKISELMRSALYKIDKFNMKINKIYYDPRYKITLDIMI